jgi:antirestriction protein ArdC
VFNEGQVDGYNRPQPATHDPVDSVLRADAFVRDTGADIRHWGEAAFYSVAEDLIMMPERNAFTGTRTSTPTESWYGVLFHELVHWTGAQHRLTRDLYVRFGSDAYAMEELIAELGAAFLCAEFAISASPREDHAAYIGHWLDVLTVDNRAILSAASKAAEATDYLLAFSRP